MKIAEVLQALLDGKKVRKRYWPKDVFIFLDKEKNVIIDNLSWRKRIDLDSDDLYYFEIYEEPKPEKNKLCGLLHISEIEGLIFYYYKDNTVSVVYEGQNKEDNKKGAIVARFDYVNLEITKGFYVGSHIPCDEKDDECTMQKCQYIHNKPCKGDGSFIDGTEAFNIYKEKGVKALQDYLATLWQEWIGDLEKVEEPKELKLQVGKTYKSRNGNIFLITGYAAEDKYPYYSGGYSFSQDGRHSEIVLSGRDLIEEYVNE